MNQNETVEHWALTVACGQACILFFLEGCFSMNQDHNSPPPAKKKLLGKVRKKDESDLNFLEESIHLMKPKSLLNSLAHKLLLEIQW